MPKVAFVINSLSNGGAERTVSNLSMNFPKDYEIDIIINDTNRIDYPYRGNLITLGLKPQENKLNLCYQIRTFFKRARILRNLKREKHYQAVISFSESANFANILSGKKYCKVILSVRVNLSSSNNKLYHAFVFPLVKCLYNYADMIIAVSKGVARDLIKNFGINPSRVTSISNGCNIDEIRRLSLMEKTEEESRALLHDNIIVTAGRLEHQKGQWHLIRALAYLKKKGLSFRMIILGVGSKEKYLRQLAHAYNMDEDVVFMGFSENPFKIVKNANVYVLPSLFEGMGNTIIEALVCGVPCISTDHDSGAREILAPNTDEDSKNKMNVERAEYGLLIPVPDGNEYSSKDPLTYEEKIMADAIEMLLINSTLNSEYRKKSIERAEDFSLKSCIKKWISVIDK